MKYLSTLLLVTLLGFCHAQSPRNNFSYPKSDSVRAWIVEAPPIHNGNTREKVVIQGFDSKFPFYYFKNNRKSAKHLVLLHGLGASKNMWVHPASRMNKLIDSLLILDYNIIIPDAKYHGERSYEKNFESVFPPSWKKDTTESKMLVEAFATTVRDVRIIFDYIEQRYPGGNIQFDLLGYSMGGSTALLISAVDPRINSVVACVSPITRPQMEIENFDWPKSIMESLIDITAMHYNTFQEAPVTLLVGESDPFYTIDEAQMFLDGIPHDDKELKVYKSGHGLPNEYIDDAMKWIIGHNRNNSNPLGSTSH